MTTTTENITVEELEAAVAAAVAATAPVEEPKVRDPWGIGGQPVEIGRTFSPDEWRTIINAEQCRQRCAGAPGVGGYGYCVREAGHSPELPHFVIDHERRVTWVWVNGLETVEDQDTPVIPDLDPADAKVTTFTSHMRVNYRNKRDIMIVLSVPRKRDERVEILDLTHQKFRKVRKELLTPARPDDPEPTQEQMMWVAQFIADRRANAYEIANREVLNGRWGRGEMNASVAKIGISPPPVRRGVSVSLNVDLFIPGKNLDGLDQGELQKAFEAAIKVAADKALPDGFSVRRVHNFYVGGVEEVQ